MSVLIGVEEVQKILDCSKPKAYQVMRELNEEFKEKGYITIRGKINKNYLLKRIGIEKAPEELADSTSAKD